jgi:hypothetical protein
MNTLNTYDRPSFQGRPIEKISDRFPSRTARPDPRKMSVFRGRYLPYGMWTTESGREILFNRDYVPIWERRDGGPPIPAEKREWVAGIIKDKTIFFYKDGTPDKARCGLKALRAWGIDPTRPPDKTPEDLEGWRSSRWREDLRPLHHAYINKLKARDVDVMRDRLWQLEIDALRAAICCTSH